MPPHKLNKIDFHSSPQAASEMIYYPGAVVINAGVYRLQHPIHHNRDGEMTYIEAGRFFPHCALLGCHVNYRLIQRITPESDMPNK